MYLIQYTDNKSSNIINRITSDSNYQSHFLAIFNSFNNKNNSNYINVINTEKKTMIVTENSKVLHKGWIYNTYNKKKIYTLNLIPINNDFTTLYNSETQTTKICKTIPENLCDSTTENDSTENENDSTENENDTESDSTSENESITKNYTPLQNYIKNYKNKYNEDKHFNSFNYINTFNYNDILQAFDYKIKTPESELVPINIEEPSYIDGLLNEYWFNSSYLNKLN